MISAVRSSSDELRRRFCQRRQIVFKALAVCSIVRSRFSPSQPVGLFGHEQQHRLAEDHVQQQSLPTASLEVPEAADICRGSTFQRGNATLSGVSS
jgi:hypothetical protein